MKSLLAKAIGTVVSLKERGATAVEYGTMVSLIAAVIISVVTPLGGNLTSLFSRVGSKL
ncbi:MAG TPA: Flp family type IVb pilin [Propionicimonas sp.]|jgi:pilus assembly protein Flp/PilA